MKLVQRFRQVVLVILVGWSGNVSAAFIGMGDIVTVGGTEWAQVSLFGGLSWNEINDVCPAGDCNAGSGDLLNGFDVSGWAWASVEQVGALFSEVTPHPGGISTAVEVDSTWAPSWFDVVGFNPTADLAPFRATQGRTSTLDVPSQRAYGAQVVDYYASTTDSASNQGLWAGLDDAFDNQGAWFFRSSASEVPVPGTFVLMLIALVGFSLCRAGDRVT